MEPNKKGEIMKKLNLTKSLAMVFLGSQLILSGCASMKSDKKTNVASADTPTASSTTDSTQSKTQNGMMDGSMINNAGMMSGMDMSQMMGMMHSCMDMHNNAKFCNQDTMKKCEASKSKKECRMLMGEVQKEEKKIKK